MLLLIGSVFIILLLLKADTGAIVVAIRDIPFSTLLVLCFLQLLTIYLLIYQWLLLGKPIFPQLTIRTMLSIHMAGTFFESITPAAKTGGETVKAILLKRQFQSTYGNAAALIALQKIFSLGAFLPVSLFSILYLLFNYPTIPGGTLLTVFTILFIIIVLLLTVSWKVWSSDWKNTGKWLWGNKLLAQMGSFRDSLKQCEKGSWAPQFVLAGVIWLLFPLKGMLIANAIQLDVNFLAISAITFAAYMVAMLPVTPGGIGTFEGTVVLLFGGLGIAMTEGLAFAFLLRILTYWFPFILSFFYCSWMGIRRKSSEIPLVGSSSLNFHNPLKKVIDNRLNASVKSDY